MSNTLTRVYQFKQEDIIGVNTIGIISDLTSFAVDGSVIIVDILSFAMAYSGGLSTFTEFSNFQRRQLTLNCIGGNLTKDNSQVLYDVLNTNGSTSITWIDSATGTDFIFEADSVGINQSVFITATITIQP